MRASPDICSTREAGRGRARILVVALALVVGVLVSDASPAAAARPRVLLIGDSTLAALGWYSSSQDRLDGLDYVLEAASCRAVTAVSCVGRRDADGRRFRPSNAVDVLRSYPAGSFDELVMMAGYDESANTFADSVVELPELARGSRDRTHHLAHVPHRRRLQRSGR